MTNNKPTSELAGEQLLDYLMNDPQQQEYMHAWAKKQFESFGYDLDDMLARTFDPDPEVTTKIEASPEYNLYYSLTTEWHTKVLAQAILSLRAE
jgi:hypothetical protein